MYHQTYSIVVLTASCNELHSWSTAQWPMPEPESRMPLFNSKHNACALPPPQSTYKRTDGNRCCWSPVLTWLSYGPTVSLLLSKYCPVLRSIFMWMSVLPAYEHTASMQCLWRPGEHDRSPGTVALVSHHVYAGKRIQVPWEQQVLLRGPSPASSSV